MNLGKEMWDALGPGYARLTLAEHGDISEMDAFTNAGLADSFSNYERFWRYHVAPASMRPTAIELRPEASDLIADVAQKSFSTFRNIFEATEQLNIICTDGLGDRDRNAIITLQFAGDALALFCGLDVAIHAVANALKVSFESPRKLASLNWKARYGELKQYRDYLAHQGTLMTLIFSDASPRVLRPEYLKGTNNWVKIIREHYEMDSHWQSLDDACCIVVNDVIELVNSAYGVLADQMDKLALNGDYQRLWGWHNGMENGPPPHTYSGGYGSGTGTGSGRSSRSSTTTHGLNSGLNG